MSRLHVANPGESSTWRNRYLFSFGAYGKAPETQTMTASSKRGEV